MRVQLWMNLKFGRFPAVRIEAMYIVHLHWLQEDDIVWNAWRFGLSASFEHLGNLPNWVSQLKY